MNKFLDYSNVDIFDGFWNKKQKMNADITINAIYDKFNETGRFESAKLNWREGQEHKPHIFWDSDIAKWIEAAAYIIQKNNSQHLIKLCDDIIDVIERKQDESGYYNIYFQTVEPSARFTKREEHELYCAGHLMEAAVAYYQATGKDKLLKVMCKYADYIEQVFVKEKSASFTTPGHEEIELALVKLYHCTGEKRYLELSKYFIDNKSKDTRFYDFVTAYYSQDHLPVREQTTAEGHSVRACYLYTAMADLAREYDDKELKSACEAIFDNIINRRMYITGGIGSSYSGEAFSIDYDLPNDTAYSESCAAIALVFFAKRMLEMDVDAKYSDIIEKVLYNGFLSNISLSGKAFFYKNPLEIIPEFKNRYPSTTERGCFPEMERLEVFTCSCCPPNISRLFATIGGYIYSENNGVLAVHQYITSQSQNVKMESGFPNNGNVKVTAKGYNKVAFRIPQWCTSYTIKMDGEKVCGEIEKGYMYIDCGGKETEFELYFDMPVVLMETNVNVTQNAGKVCVMRGPIVYCAEKVDNEKGVHRMYVGSVEGAKVEFNEEFNANTITLNGFVKEDIKTLYAPVSDRYTPCEFKLIPYYAFANRGPSEMMVWLNKK